MHLPNGEYMTRPGSKDWQDIAQRQGRAVLAVSYLPPGPGDSYAHFEATLNSGQGTVSMIPVR